MKNLYKQIIILVISQITFGNTLVNIMYDSASDIYGFQFYVEGVDVISASGGDAESSGFTISTGNNTVLGFSFSGTYINSGAGVLTTLEVDGDISSLCLNELVLSGAGGSDLGNEIVNCTTVYYSLSNGTIYGCTDMNACNYEEDATDDDNSCLYDDCIGDCGGSAIEDECGVCNGDGSSCNGQNNSGIITYNTNVDIYGFQFRVDNVELTNIYGGNAESAGFTVSYSSASGMVIGFSFSGSYIPSGSGALVNINFNGNPDDLCISNLVLSGQAGSSLSADIIECTNIYYEECEDIDQDSICDYNDDCIGEYDECGVCNGGGIVDGACDCDGNILDCAGECGGNALEDECGVCSGTGQSCGANGVVYLSYIEISPGIMEVYYESDSDIAGLQFEISGILLSNVYGGVTEDVGFSVSFSDSALVAFTLTGNNIPSGSGILFNLNYMSIAEESCISETIFGNSYGAPMLIINDNCIQIDYTEVLGCMDSSACNFNLEANNDDGSCSYSDINYDCDGNCIAVIDCEGLCGGEVFDYICYL